MPISVECNDCSKRYSVDDALAGRRVRCKSCGGIMLVPGQPSLAASGAGGPPQGNAGTPRPAPAPKRPAPPPPRANAAAAPAPAEPEDPFAALEELERTGTLVDGGARPPAASRSAASQSSGYAPPPGAQPWAPPSAPAVAMIGYAPRPRRVAAVGMDSATPWLILLYLLANVGFLVYALVQISGTEAPAGPFWSLTVTNLVTFFALIGPAVFLALFIASKIMKFPLQDAAYLRACGIAAIPGVIGAIIVAMPPNPVLALILAIAIAPLAFYVIKYVFDLTWAEAAVAFAFVVPLYSVAQFVTVLILAVSAAGAMAGAAGKASRGRQGAVTARNLPGANRSSSASDSAAPTPKVDPETARLNNATQLVTRFAARDFSRQSRESVLREFALLKAEVGSSKAVAVSAGRGADPGWQTVYQTLADIQKRASELPSEAPDPSIFEVLPKGGQQFTTQPGPATHQEEVSYRAYKVRPPQGALLNLQSSERGAAGLWWEYKKTGGGSLAVRHVPATNPRQKRPWVATHPFMLEVARQQKLFVLDASSSAAGGAASAGAPVVTTGTLNDIPVTRVEYTVGTGHFAHRVIQYVSLEGGEWLVVEAKSPQQHAQTADLMESGALTLRRSAPGDPKLDPFAPERIAPRLADDAEDAKVILRRQGAAAEVAVAAQLKSDSVWVRRAAAELLSEIATVKSAPVLQEAAQSRDDDVAKFARAALGRIAPTQFDKTSEALLDLKGRDPWKKEAAFKALAAGPADPKRREEVAKVLEDMLTADRVVFDADKIGRALAVWHGPNTVNRLLPMVLDENGHHWAREGVLLALAGTQDKRAVKPILMWMIKEPDRVIEAISAMGPVAEAEVIARYNMAMGDKTKQGATIRANCVRMLQAVGHTPQALATLTRAAGDRRDAAGAELAKSAVDVVKARIAQKAPPKPATKPAG